MLDFFAEGGWGMYPVLGLGVVMLVGAGRYAADLSPARLRFVVGVGLTLLITMTHASLTGAAMVMWFLESRERVPDAEFARVLVTGLKECSRPWAMGGAFFSLSGILVCVGLHRATQRAAA